VLTGLCSLLLFACASGLLDAIPALQINGMRIENHTELRVSAVRLLVPATGNFVSCGNITPGSMCSTTFPEANYTGNPVEITWSQAGQIFSSGEFVLELPVDFNQDKPAMVRVVIAGPGSAGAILVQKQEL
jgi:hypothetical protein